MQTLPGYTAERLLLVVVALAVALLRAMDRMWWVAFLIELCSSAAPTELLRSAAGPAGSGRVRAARGSASPAAATDLYGSVPVLPGVHRRHVHPVMRGPGGSRRRRPRRARSCSAERTTVRTMPAAIASRDQCQAELNTCRGPEAVAYAEPQAQYRAAAGTSSWSTRPTAHDGEPPAVDDGPVDRHEPSVRVLGRWPRAPRVGVPMYSKRTGELSVRLGRQRDRHGPPGRGPADHGLRAGGFESLRRQGHGREGLTVRYRITWYKYSTLPTNLLLVDIDCTRGAMYCNDQMRRR